VIVAITALLETYGLKFVPMTHLPSLGIDLVTKQIVKKLS
jgi:hypothetical protein